MDRTNLEARIREDLERWAKNKEGYAENRAEFIDMSLDLGRDLLEARGTFRQDQQFGAWLITQELDKLNKHDRSALINMAVHPDLFKKAMDGCTKRSYQRLYEIEYRPLLEAQKKEKEQKAERFPTPRKPPEETPPPSPKQEEKASPKPAPYAGSPAMTPHEQWVKDHPKQEGEAQSPKAKYRTEEERIKREVEKQVKIIEAQLRAESELRIVQEIERRLQEIVLPEWKRQVDEAKLIVKSRRGVFTDEQYKLIVRCLHPDTGEHVKPEVRAEAFRLFNENKLVLTKGENPMRVAPSNPVPRDPREWVRKSREERARREAAKRGG